MNVGKATLQLASDIGDSTKLYLYGSRKNTVLVDISNTLKDKTKAYLSLKLDLPMYRNMYSKNIIKLAQHCASKSEYQYGEAFRAFHNIHSFPY